MSDTYNGVTVESHGKEVLKACIRATCETCAAKPGSYRYRWHTIHTIENYDNVYHITEPFDGYIACKAYGIRRAFNFFDEVNE
jgi:hypothetical protein